MSELPRRLLPSEVGRVTYLENLLREQGAVYGGFCRDAQRRIAVDVKRGEKVERFTGTTFSEAFERAIKAAKERAR